MKRVLIVDDDDDFRESLSTALILEGFEVRTARNGREGLHLLEAETASVVLLDLMMPVMSGWDLIAAMKADPALTDIPTAVVSAAHAPGGLPSTTSVFAKPFRLADLLQFLRQRTQ